MVDTVIAPTYVGANLPTACFRSKRSVQGHVHNKISFKKISEYINALFQATSELWSCVKVEVVILGSPRP